MTGCSLKLVPSEIVLEIQFQLQHISHTYFNTKTLVNECMFYIFYVKMIYISLFTFFTFFLNIRLLLDFFQSCGLCLLCWSLASSSLRCLFTNGRKNMAITLFLLTNGQLVMRSLWHQSVQMLRTLAASELQLNDICNLTICLAFHLWFTCFSLKLIFSLETLDVYVGWHYCNLNKLNKVDYLKL